MRTESVPIAEQVTADDWRRAGEIYAGLSERSRAIIRDSPAFTAYEPRDAQVCYCLAHIARNAR